MVNTLHLRDNLSALSYWIFLQVISFKRAQRRCNGLFRFTALGAGGIQRENVDRTSRERASCVFMARLIMGYLICNNSLEIRMNVSNSSRFCIYHSEFAEKCSSLNLDEEVANTLCTHIHENVEWAQNHRSAVDSISNNPDVHNPDLPPPYIEFADVSRTNDGPILGEQVSAPEIAALVYTSGQQDSGKRAVVTYPVNTPDSKPCFLPLWSPAYETPQFPLLFLHGEAGRSKGNASETDASVHTKNY